MKLSKLYNDSSSDSNDEVHDFGLNVRTNIDMYITKKVENDKNLIYEIEKLLQETRNSAVFTLTDKNYVMKCIPRFKFVEHEVYLMKALNHKYIMKCHDFILKDRFAAIIMPRAKSGLFEYISPQSFYNEESYVCVIIKSALEALSYLHKNGVWHRDIKLENILIMKETEEGPIINITDFGLSCRFENEPQCFRKLKCTGTAIYAAPELIEKCDTEYGIRFKDSARYNCTIDIWSLGIVMYFLFSKMHPFLRKIDNNRIIYDLDAAERGQIIFDIYFEEENPFNRVSEFAKDVIRTMLNPDPANRCGADEILSMEWFDHFRESKPVLAGNVFRTIEQTTKLIYEIQE